VSILEREAKQKTEALQIKEGSLSNIEVNLRNRTDELNRREQDISSREDAYRAKDRQLKEIING
jgi:uncharacterized protein (DUF3084 family)